MKSTHKFLTSVHIILGLKLFAITVVVKHMAIALPNLVIVSVCKDVKVTDFDGNFFLILGFTFVVHQILATVKPQVTAVAQMMSSSTGLLLSSNNINSPTNMPSTSAGLVARR